MIWTDMSVELPPEGRFIACLTDGSIWILRCSIQDMPNGGTGRVYRNNYKNIKTNLILAWMPLPEKYEVAI